MNTKTLKEIIFEVGKNKKAVGHFNISEIAALKGIFVAARELNLPVIIGVSEGEAEFIGGYRQAAALVKGLAEEFNYPIFINADHVHSFEKVEEAARVGFDAVLFDAGKLSLGENIKMTKEAVERAKKISAGRRPPGGGEILVEGELGYIGGSSSLLESVPKGAEINEEDLTRPEEAAQFVRETGVDLLAPAVGNLHGIITRTRADWTLTDVEISAENPKIDIERIKKIKEAAGVPLVLHGGSGISDEDFLKAIDAGVSIIHINTELRLAWRKGLEMALREKPQEIAPYKLLAQAVEEIKKVVYNRLKLFNNLNQK